MVRVLALLFAGILALSPLPAAAFPDPTASPATNASVPREVIVRFRAEATDWQRDALRTRMNGRVKWQFRRPDVQLIELESGTAEDVILQLADDPLIEYIEPNYRVQILATPNDPRFSELYGMRNTGQTGGTAGADIRAPRPGTCSPGIRRCRSASSTPASTTTTRISPPTSGPILVRFPGTRSTTTATGTSTTSTATTS